MVTSRDAWGFSLFCDDIRPEIGGKMSVMGIYQSDMISPPNFIFPLVIPKFCILIKYYELKDAFSDDINVRVFMPGDAKDAPSIALPFPRTQLNAEMPPPCPLEEDQERVFNFTFPLTIAPFQVKQEGFAKVRFLCGAITTNLGSLLIRTARPGEQVPGLGPQPGPIPQPAG